LCHIVSFRGIAARTQDLQVVPQKFTRIEVHPLPLRHAGVVVFGTVIGTDDVQF
jgi:hypothetical protein